MRIVAELFRNLSDELSPREVDELVRQGFLGPEDVEASLSPRGVRPGAEPDPQEHLERPRPDRRKGGSRPGALSSAALRSRIRGSRPSWVPALDELRKLGARVASGDPLVAIREANAAALADALVDALHRESPGFSGLWLAIDFAGYRILGPADRGDKARAYRCVEQRLPFEDFGPHAWIVKWPEVREAVNLTQAQLAVLRAFGHAYAEAPRRLVPHLRAGPPPTAFWAFAWLHTGLELSGWRKLGGRRIAWPPASPLASHRTREKDLESSIDAPDRVLWLGWLRASQMSRADAERALRGVDAGRPPLDEALRCGEGWANGLRRGVLETRPGLRTLDLAMAHIEGYVADGSIGRLRRSAEILQDYPVQAGGEAALRFRLAVQAGSPVAVIAAVEARGLHRRARSGAGLGRVAYFAAQAVRLAEHRFPEEYLRRYAAALVDLWRTARSRHGDTGRGGGR